MSLDLQKLQAQASYFDASGRPTMQMQIFWQQTIEAIEAAVNTIGTTLDDIIDLNDLITSANAAIAAAEVAIVNADAAAAAAQTSADNVTSAQELGTSYVSGATIGSTDAGTDATITISAHTRHYPQPNGSTVDVAVTGGSLTGQAYSTQYFIYYDDAGRVGGAVTYVSTTSESTAAQIGARHVVGKTTTPAALGAPTGGSYTRPPGSGAIP